MTNGEVSNDERMPETIITKRSDNGGQRVYDLEERTALFGEAVLAYARRLPVSAVTAPLVSQIVRSGTSIGANYCEADDAESKKDFLQ
jgi:hypothetical protein